MTKMGDTLNLKPYKNWKQFVNERNGWYVSGLVFGQFGALKDCNLSFESCFSSFANIVEDSKIVRCLL